MSSATPEYAASIVIPTFNRVGMLRRALRTALDQTVSCEVIVADHGSTDGTPEMMRAHEGRVRYLRREHDHGPVFAWLDGVVSAGCEYVHITYDDDWLAPEFIERCLATFTPECAFVFTGVNIQWPDGRVDHLFEDFLRTGTHPAQLIEDYLLSIPLTVSPGCALFRRKDVLQAMQFDGVPTATHQYHGAGADLLMYLLPLLKHSKFGFVNEPLAFFSAHEGSITVNATSSAEKAMRLREGYEEIRRFYLVLKDDLATRRGERLRRRAAVGRLIRQVARRLRRELGIG